jgi:putative cell wall-binding protein
MDRIEVLEKNQKRIEVSIENKKFRTKARNDKYQMKINKLNELIKKYTGIQNKFIEQKQLELDKNSKMIIAEAEYAKNIGCRYVEKAKIKKSREQEHKKEVEAIKREAKQKGILR